MGTMTRGKIIALSIAIILLLVVGVILYFFVTGIPIPYLTATKPPTIQEPAPSPPVTITATILAIDAVNHTLELSFTQPLDFVAKQFGKQLPVQTVKISCTNGQTSYYAVRVPENLPKSEQQTPQKLATQLIQKNFDLFDLAKVGDTFIGACANQKCSEISENCQIIRAFFVPSE
jgi:hypothetical protein